VIFKTTFDRGAVRHVATPKDTIRCGVLVQETLYIVVTGMISPAGHRPTPHILTLPHGLTPTLREP